jgi:LPXTG-motif cell wall-anchored protein
MNAIYEVVPAEITANYIYDDADQTQVKPTQTVTPDQASDVTLPTTNLEKIVLTSGNGKNGVPTTLTLKFNSDFTVTHLILNEGTDNEFILPVATETLGAFLDANEAGTDLSQAVLDDLAGSGIGEDATSPDVYQGFLANLAKTGIHINGNVALANPETYTQLKDVTYVYATPDKQPVTIEAVDDVTGDVLETAELTGYPDFTTTYDTQALIDKYTAMNYVVAANDIPEVITFDDDSTASQVYQLHLTHHVTHSTAETTQTVTFTDEDGKTMAPSVDETITWNVSTDDVTGDKVATAQKSYDAVDAPVIEGYVATPTVVTANYPAATKGELADTTVQVIYKKKAVAGDGGTTTPGGTDVTQPGTDQSTVTTPETEQPMVVEPSGETAPEAEQPGTGEQPAAGVDGEDAETPETVASNGTATGNVEAANGQALTGRVAGSQASNADAQRLPQTAERDGRVGSVMGLALAGMLSLLGLSGLRKKRS